ITRWFNLSETTFLLPPEADGADYRARIFTLERELPFAGHPTLGSAAAWLSAGHSAGHDARIVQACEAGLIDIRRDGTRFAFAAPPMIRYEEPDEEKIAEVCQFLRIDRDAIEDVRWVDNGPGWLGVRLASAAEVLAIDPRSHHPRRIDVGLVGRCEPGADYDFELRALFSNQHGAVIEDPVTGSLNAAVAQWLMDSGVAGDAYTAGQGQRVGRAGRIDVRREDGRLWIGGNTSVIVTGHIDIEPSGA
ncbi:MAG: PhzF family phenazine biosynthesis protein, partial [Woeseiaceae bacterium]|nr:PhzF family phenazine biosynthesis protein [Woeseiaceae bacterium]